MLNKNYFGVTGPRVVSKVTPGNFAVGTAIVTIALATTFGLVCKFTGLSQSELMYYLMDGMYRAIAEIF